MLIGQCVTQALYDFFVSHKCVLPWKHIPQMDELKEFMHLDPLNFVGKKFYWNLDISTYQEMNVENYKTNLPSDAFTIFSGILCEK